MTRTTSPFRIALLAAATVVVGFLLRPHIAAAAPAFSLNPTSLLFFGTQGSAGVPIPPLWIDVENAGSGNLEWQASSAANWITLSPTTGGPNPAFVTVQVTNNLPAGVYTSKVDFTSTNNPGITASVDVTFTVNAAAVLSVNKTAYTFTAVQNKTAPDQLLTVQSGAAAGWTGTVNTGAAPAWLSITPTADTVYNDPTDPVHIRVNAAGLAINEYAGTITITSTGAVPSSVVITVKLKVTPPPIMNTAPRPLTLTLDEGGTAKPTLEISNSGASETELNWSMNQPTESWIKLSLTGNCDGPFPPTISGFTAGGRKSAVTVCITTAPAGLQLELGAYAATLSISAPGATILPAGADSVPVSLTVVDDVTKPTVASGSIFYGYFNLTTTPVNQIVVPPSADCSTIPSSTSVMISWTSSEYGNTRLKWGERLGSDGVPLYERGTILKPEGLNVATHDGGTMYHTVSLSNMNYVYAGHAYYFAIASDDRNGNVGDWTDHSQSNPSLFLSFTITHSCDVSAPTNVSLQLPASALTLFGTITVVVSAQDESMVTRFELVKKNPAGSDAVLANYPVAPTQCTSNGDSYSCLVTVTYDTKRMPDGASTLVARAYDALGSVGTSPQVAISVSNAVPAVANAAAAPTDLGDGRWRAVITWDTNTASDSSVQYGIEEDDGSFKGYTFVQSGDDSGSTNIQAGHRVTLSGLLAGRVYHYMITSCPVGISDPERCGH